MRLKLGILLTGLLLLLGGSASAQIQVVSCGVTANDGTGDPFRTAFMKINTNFTYVETQLVNSTNVANLAAILAGTFDPINAAQNATNVTRLATILAGTFDALNAALNATNGLNTAVMAKLADATNHVSMAVAYGTYTNASIYWPTNPFPVVAGTALEMDKNYQFVNTNNTVNITGFTAVSNALVSWCVLSVSNSAASAITIQWPSSVRAIGGTNSSASVSLTGGKVWKGTFEIDPHGTNLSAAAQIN